MKIRVFKKAVTLLVVLCTIVSPVLAQAIVAEPVSPAPVAVLKPVIAANVVVNPNPVIIAAKVNTKAVKVNVHKLEKQINKLTANVQTQVSSIINNLNVNLDNIAPQIELGFKDIDVNIISDPQNDGDDQVKTYTKTYPADGNDVLVIDNRYGNIVVNTWNRNEFKVTVEIRAGNNSSQAKKMLDNVNVVDAKDGSTVAFKTNIGDVSGSWLSKLSGGHSNSGMQINYKVYMPAKNELVIDNRYGEIVLPDLDGKVTINSAYGGLSAKSLNNQSAIRVKYGNVNIGSLGTTALDVSYSGFNIGSVDKLEANINYCTGTAKIGKIRSSASINIKYGEGLQIGDLDRNVKDLAINASYAHVRIGLSGDESADFAVSTHYGYFKYDDHNVSITSKNPDDEKGPHFTKAYKGYIGKGNSGRNIAVNANYSNVEFD